MSQKSTQLPLEPFDNVVARISPSPSPRIETETHIIYQEPRISASLLAQYIVADPSRQKTILKNSKFCRKGMAFGYAKARHAVMMSFLNGTLDSSEILRRSNELKQEPASGIALKENQLSSSALEAFSKMGSFPVIEGATKIKRPKTGWDKLEMSGVHVTLEPQLVFSVSEKGVTKVGGLLFHPTKSISLNKEQNGIRAGEYAAVLLLRMLEEELASVGVPSPSRCLVVDVYRGDTYTAPKSFKTMLNHMRDACENIAARWSGIRQQ